MHFAQIDLHKEFIKKPIKNQMRSILCVEKTETPIFAHWGLLFGKR